MEDNQFCMFCKKIKAYRDSLNKTQAEMAEFFEISLGYYGDIERGIKSPSLKMLKRIAKKTGRAIPYWLDTDNVATEKVSIPLQLDGQNKPMAINPMDILAALAKISVELGENAESYTDIQRHMIYEVLAECQRSVENIEELKGSKHTA